MSDKQPGISPSMLPNLAACRAFEAGASCSTAAKRGVRIDKAIREAWTAQNGGMLFDYAFFLSSLTPKDRESVEWALTELEILQAANGAPIFTEGPEIQAAAALDGIAGGTLDAISPQARLLVEFKTGDKRDYAGQLAAYAAACCKKYHVAAWRCVTIYIDKRETENHVFSIDAAEQTVQSIVASPFKRTTGPHCQWCGAKCWRKDKWKGK